MRTRIASVFLLLAVPGCAVPGAPPLPPDMRPDLNPKWLDAAGHFRWPKHYGFAEEPVPVVLPPGMLIDRFGSDLGTFFSPKGASFDGRALPYVCAIWPYTAYEVLRPVLAWTGTAAPWFDEPGGVTQFRTDASAAWLVADAVLRPLPGIPPPCSDKDR
ncbi:MAG TPA: TNT domain-containing protein [Stellaceae bacterium]|nr:TNT domain-containing protein [Stellaceae bacterium]